MSGINPINFQQMRPEKQRKIATINKSSKYDKMQNQKLSEYYIKYIKPKGVGKDDIMVSD